MTRLIRAVQIKIVSGGDLFGFQCEFDGGLNIIRGKNSSGKSTLINTLMYGLGLEELVGGKGERVLTSAVRDGFTYKNAFRRIDKSAVLVEVENAEGKITTFRRPIRNQHKSTKLMEVFEGPLLTNGKAVENMAPAPLFLHDGGSATLAEGFINYFESFLGWKLPPVQSSTGGLTRLYPQVVAAALFIEQKRGWTDYIANIPFYQILGAPTRVVQYLLGLSNFATEETRALYTLKLEKLRSDWSQALAEIKSVFRPLGITLRGVPREVISELVPDKVSASAQVVGGEISIAELIRQKTAEWQQIHERRTKPPLAAPEIIKLLNSESRKLEEIAAQYDLLSAEARLRNSSLEEFKALLQQTEIDLKKNKATRKLRDLGAEAGLGMAEGHCPTCGSDIPDSLMPRVVGVESMDLQSNIDYLEAQARMLRRQIGGLEQSNLEAASALSRSETLLSEQRKRVVDIRGSLSQADANLEADIRKQVSLEREVRDLQYAETRFQNFLDDSVELAKSLVDVQQKIKKLPGDLYSDKDKEKISLLQKNFRANAGAFGYSSVEDIEKITVHSGTLLPALGDITLKEVLSKNVRSESSASDFVRLIWAFLLAIYQTSEMRDYRGNHPRFLLFDEPGQHSMSQLSQRALVQAFSGEINLQSVIAASFEESPTVFREVTAGSRFKLIDLPEKIIMPMLHDGLF
ncbi:AAA family ATPase [Achromobacter xylosoxidans]|uniref:AAA family ATPase n=1 Tax=Alcaligenes xylosoxydans xylosoxydans TaxID=85698 RepID=UPI001F141C53|nr:AAA family ATPase [Achromobacter xylosoxidans]MDC6164325.1 AAA family ATPase [Achromobacter xylosoxidans]